MSPVIDSLGEKGGKAIQLLEDEMGGMMFAPSTNSITFFNGSVTADSLRHRIGLIVQSNPWLLSRLFKSDNDGKILAKFPLSDESDSGTSCFRVRAGENLSSSMPYCELLEAVSEDLVPIGNDCINKDILQWRVTLYEIKRDCEYALVVSLSHVIGDGHTFYSLHTMLSSDAPIIALMPERHSPFGSQLVECVGQPLQDWIYSSHFSQGITNTLQRPQPSVCGYTVSREEIQRLKSEVKEGFISTNDILVSWFCSLCHSSYGLMVVNFRNRVEGLTDLHSGNYHKILVYSQDQYSSPEGVRQTLPTFNRGGRLPSEQETLDFNVAMVTNWSAFYREIELTSCAGERIRSVAHFPLLNAASINFRDCCVIFNKDADTLAVMLFTRSPVNIPSLVEGNHPSVRVLSQRII